MTTRHRQLFYGVLAVVGLFATWIPNIKFMAEKGGFSIQEFVAASYANAASTSIANDLLVVVVAFTLWSFIESRRLGMRHWWAYMVLMWTVAIAVAYPLFLLMRERRMEVSAG